MRLTLPLAFLATRSPPTSPPTTTTGIDEFEAIVFGQYFDSTDRDIFSIDSWVGESLIVDESNNTKTFDYLESLLFEYDFGSEDLDPLVLEDYLLDKQVNTIVIKTTEFDYLEVYLFDPDDLDNNFGTF